MKFQTNAMSCMMKKPSMLFLTRSNTNQSIQSMKQARSLNFWVLEKEGLYYLCSETKTLISAVTALLICAFVFANACCWITYAAAPIILQSVAALLRPFGMCAEFLNPEVIRSVLANGMERAIKYVQNLEEKDFKEKVGITLRCRRF